MEEIRPEDIRSAIQSHDSVREALDGRTCSQILCELLIQKGIAPEDEPNIYRLIGMSKARWSELRPRPDGSCPINLRTDQFRRYLLRLCIALRLNQWEAVCLLGSARAVFNRDDAADALTLYCIQQGIYSPEGVNAEFERYRQDPLFP